jgi:AbiV family abortive infection protein
VGRPRPKLTDEQLRQLSGGCLANAVDLLNEALILVDEDRLPRAVFLSLLAFEELLKSRYCEMTLTDDWPAFWKGFRDHKTKLENASTYLGEEVPQEAVAALIEMRERTLYVEVHHDGRTLTPRGLVDPGGLNPEFIRSWVTRLSTIGSRLTVEYHSRNPDGGRGLPAKETEGPDL